MATILVIDDEPDLRAVFACLLEKAGHEVVLASGARDGLAAFARHRPDIVITDVVLPDESGLNLVLELTRHKTAPVIVMSGSDIVGGRDLLSFATLVGACRALLKPVRRAELIAAVDDALRPRRLRDDRGDATCHVRRPA